MQTRRGGAAAKAGHDLDIEVTAWEATLEAGEDPEATRAELTADATSLRVRTGTGGMQALGDEDKASIHQTIDDEVLKRQHIVFRSTRVRGHGGGPERGGRPDPRRRDAADHLRPRGRRRRDARATAIVTQSRWGMKPYSAMWGALKVLDDVEVVLEGKLEVG